jgi:hypothetical protein
LCRSNKLHIGKKLAQSLHNDWHKEPPNSAVFSIKVIQKPLTGVENRVAYAKIAKSIAAQRVSAIATNLQ